MIRGRTCLGCRQQRPRSELVRLVRKADGFAWVDESGHAAGRGAYLCHDEACFDRGLRRIAGALRGARIDEEKLRGFWRKA
ncbi:MAG: YlxR family protein [Actinomycetota bacterium]